MRLGVLNAWLRARLPASLGGRLSQDDLTHRVLGPDDLQECLALYGPEVDAESTAANLETDAGFLMGAWLGARLVGVAGVYPQFAGVGLTDLFSCGSYVRRRDRSRGIARSILRACVTETRNRGEIDLWAHIISTEQAAITMCKAAGFIEFARPDWRLIIGGADCMFLHYDLKATEGEAT